METSVTMFPCIHTVRLKKIMHLFFADDSSTTGKREHMKKLVAFGGVLIPMDKVKSHCDSLEEIIVQAGVPKSTEIKWSLPRDNWIRDNLKGEARKKLYTDLLDCTVVHDGQAVVIVWDVCRTSEDERSAFRRCVDFAFERVSVHLAKKNSQCLVIADRAGSHSDDDQFLADFIERVENGTEFVNSGQVLLNVLTTHSHLIRQLQIADIITAVSTSMVAGNIEYAEPVFQCIKPLLMQNNGGTIGGTGLKVYPKELTNLYHWVIGEHVYTKGGGAMGWKIPSENLPYFASPNKV